VTTAYATIAVRTSLCTDTITKYTVPLGAQRRSLSPRPRLDKMRGAGHKAKRRRHHTRDDHGTMAAAAGSRALGAQHALEQREQARAAGERNGEDGEDGAERRREGHGRGAARVCCGSERLKAEGQGRAAAAESGWHPRSASRSTKPAVTFYWKSAE
jgi:hypothetical protein